MSLPFRTLGPTELLPRYVFAEPLFLRRRVLEVGAVASTAGASAHFLRTRGARTVLACDDDAAAVAAASAGNDDEALRFRACVFEDLEPASFDLLLVADLAPYIRAPGLLAELLRLRAPHGHLVAGLRNPGGLALARLGEPEPSDAPPTYGQALDALAGHVASVEVATQAAVLGYQLAFDRGEGLQVDGTLGGPGEVAYYVLVAGDAPAQRCEPVWVQLPPEPLAHAGGRVESQVAERDAALKRTRALGAELSAVQQERDAVVARQASLQGALDAANAELGRLLARVQQLESAGGSARGQDALSLRVRQLELAVSAAEAARAEAEADAQRAHTAEARAREATAEWTRDAESSRRREQVLAEQLRTGLATLEAMHAERDALARKVARLEEEVSSGKAGAHAGLAEAQARADEAAERAARAEREVAALRAELEVALRTSGPVVSGPDTRGATIPSAAEWRRRAVEADAWGAGPRSSGAARPDAVGGAPADARGVERMPAEDQHAAGAPRPGAVGGAAVDAPGAGRTAVERRGDPARGEDPSAEVSAAIAGSAEGAPAPDGWTEERARLEARISDLERMLRDRNRAYDALSREREDTEARFQNSEQALRSLREALDAAAAQGR